MKHAIRIAAGLAVSAFFLWFALRGFDFGHLREAVARIRIAYLLPAVFMFTGVLALRAFRWYLVLQSVARIRYRDVAPTLAVGYLANNVLPARGGEIVRAAALSRKTDTSFATVAGSLIADRTTDLVGFAAVMLVAARLLPWDKIPIKPVAGAAVAGLAVMYVLSIVLARLKPEASGGVKQKLLSFAAKIGTGFSAIRSPGRVAALIAVSVGVWLTDAATTMVLARSVGLSLSYTQSAGVLVGVAAGVAIPAAPGYVGTYEFFGKEAMVMMGFEPATALTFVVLLHFFQLAMMAALGIPSLFLIGKNKK